MHESRISLHSPCIPRLNKQIMKNLALLSTLLLLAACASTRPDIEIRPQSSSGEFVITCPMNSRAADDPIVKPGQAGASHSHDFFGARKIDANSTPESMKASGTSCDKTPGDTAGYWTPTVYKADGTPLKMERARLYYRTGSIRKEYVKPFPQGLKIVAGDAMAMESQDFDIVSWACTIAGGGDAGNERG